MYNDILIIHHRCISTLRDIQPQSVDLPIGQCVTISLVQGFRLRGVVLTTSSEGETVENVSYHLELLRLLASCLPACKFGRSFCRFFVSFQIRQYRIIITVTGR